MGGGPPKSRSPGRSRRFRFAQLSVISPISTAPPASGAMVSGIAGLLSADDAPRDGERRRGAAARRTVVVVRATARPVEVARLEALRRAVPAAFLTPVVARLVLEAARLVELVAR